MPSISDAIYNYLILFLVMFMNLTVENNPAYGLTKTWTLSGAFIDSPDVQRN